MVLTPTLQQAIRLLQLTRLELIQEASQELQTNPVLEESTTIEEPAGATLEAGTVAVPVLSGLPARSALRALEAVELVGELRGSGRVTSQSPRPGQVVERGGRVRLVLAPPRS